MRARQVVTLPLFLFALGCGGEAKVSGPGGAGAGGASTDAGGPGAGSLSTDAGGACAAPVSAIPSAGAFQVSAPTESLTTYQITFHNRCTQTVWPAWGSAGGLDNSLIDTQLWFPMSPGSDRTVTVYGGSRELGFWGRTRCSFDQAGHGVCETGECGGFICAIDVNQFPASTTVFVLAEGFLGGYNGGLRVEGTSCGDQKCVADLGSCSQAPVQDSCGGTIACGDICSASPACCHRPTGCAEVPGTTADGDLVVTFCP